MTNPKRTRLRRIADLCLMDLDSAKQAPEAEDDDRLRELERLWHRAEIDILDCVDDSLAYAVVAAIVEEPGTASVGVSANFACTDINKARSLKTMLEGLAGGDPPAQTTK